MHNAYSKSDVLFLGFRSGVPSRLSDIDTHIIDRLMFSDYVSPNDIVYLDWARSIRLGDEYRTAPKNGCFKIKPISSFRQVPSAQKPYEGTRLLDIYVIIVNDPR